MSLRKLLVPALAIAVGVAGCAPDAGPVQPTPATPMFMISDALHNSGNPHFFFIRPVVDTSKMTAAFDESAQPTVTICSLAATNELGVVSLEQQLTVRRTQ